MIAAVSVARENGLDIAVRGGGHSVPGFGTADDAVVIDLAGMTDVQVDPEAQTARAQGGATWGVFNDATHAHGLATTGGIVSTTGVGGLTLGGGIGYLARGVGLSCDNLHSAEVVTADGQKLVAKENENEDLFWALRGGGGNFGVVTSFELRLHPVAEIYGGPIFFDAEDAGTVLRAYREYIADAPEQFGGFPAWQIAPPLPFIPEKRQGETMLTFVTCWAGPVEDGEQPSSRSAKRRRSWPSTSGRCRTRRSTAPSTRSTRPGPPALLEGELRERAHRRRDRGPPRARPKVPVVNSTVHIYSINGACHRVAPDATAFAYRDATFATVIAGMWPDPADNEANSKWVRDYYDATAPFSEEGGYVNFMSGDDQERIKANYRGNYDRLVDVKRKYDPDNLFHHNQNIRP